MFTCLLCENRAEGYREFLCFLCLSSFENFSERRQDGLVSLYPYHSASRSLVLQAKVKACPRALFCLVHLLKARMAEHPQAYSADWVLPAPSSLFSRMRGSFDIAFFLAEALCREHSAKLLMAPFSFYFSLKKRARLERKGELFSLKAFSHKDKRKPNLLIVDDVITTGYTLSRLSHLYQKDFNLSFLTLCYARK